MKLGDDLQKRNDLHGGGSPPSPAISKRAGEEVFRLGQKQLGLTRVFTEGATKLETILEIF